MGEGVKKGAHYRLLNQSAAVLADVAPSIVPYKFSGCINKKVGCYRHQEGIYKF